MRYYPRIITKRGTVKIFNDHWHGERFGSLVERTGLAPGNLVFVCLRFIGDVPVLCNTNNSPDDYGNEICRLERVE
jgi:hypothetical protein